MHKISLYLMLNIHPVTPNGLNLLLLQDQLRIRVQLPWHCVFVKWYKLELEMYSKIKRVCATVFPIYIRGNLLVTLVYKTQLVLQRELVVLQQEFLDMNGLIA